jgi:hypothetical protein
MGKQGFNRSTTRSVAAGGAIPIPGEMIMMLKMSQGLGRQIRTDDAPALGDATYRLLIDAIQQEEWTQVRQLSEYFFQELNTIRKVYVDWCRDMVTWFSERHGKHDLWLIEQTTSPWYEARYQNVMGLDATDLFRRLIVNESSEALLSRVASELLSTIGRREREASASRTEDLRSQAQLLHDIYTDWCWSIMTCVSRMYGEEEVAKLIRDTVIPWFKARYDRYFALPGEDRLQLTVEGMRGHLCGPGRLGDVEVSDEGNRWIISFDPCGSGGRMRRGDPLKGDPPRTDAPYNFGVSSRPHDWTWGQTGVCYYCAHCAIVNEQLAIDTYGDPIRVTDYPRDPNHPCRWIIYKNVEDIPEEYYTRVGRRKPRSDST